MNKNKVINILENEGLYEIDEINYKKDYVILDAYYKFDKVEVEGAISFSNESCGEEKNDTWYEDYYFPYLYDIAIDNLSEVLEEIAEEEDIVIEFTLCEMDVKVNNKCEVIIVLSNKEFDMDEVLENIEK